MGSGQRQTGLTGLATWCAQLMRNTKGSNFKEGGHMADYTDITVLVDRSGSMEKIKHAMESGFREFLMQHRKVPTSRLTLIQFDTDNPQEVVYSALPIGEARDLYIAPRGGTPLLDALCRAIDATGDRLHAMTDRPARVLFVIITDGEENSSKEFKRADVRKRVDTQHGTYKWQFVYLGANQDAYHEAATLGIPMQHTMNYAATKHGTTNATRAVTANTLSYVTGQSVAVPDFSPDQMEQAMADDED